MGAKFKSKLLLMVFITLIFSSLAFASFIPEEVIYNKVYDNNVFFTSSDFQYFTVESTVNLTELKVIGKASPDYVLANPVLIIQDDTNTTIKTLLTLDEISYSYFSDIIFNLNNLQLPAGVYRFKLQTIGGFNYFYSDTSNIDTYINGGINSLNSKNDAYFIFYGNYLEGINTDLQKSEEILNQLLGEDLRIFLLAGIGVLIGILFLLAQYIKQDFFILVIIILASMLLYFIGLMSFYLVGLIIVSDIVSFIYGGKNESI